MSIRSVVRAHVSILAGVSAIASVAACAATGGGAGSAATAADTAAINQVATTWADGYNKKDVATVMSTYESDASELFSSGKLLKGTAAITAELTANSAQWAHLVITPVTPYQISGDMAVATGTTATHVPGPGGQTLTIPGAYIVTLHKSAGAWKLSSVAAIPDSATVAGMAAAAAAKPAPKSGKAK
jgi:ketosteroid isomerase-like protein